MDAFLTACNDGNVHVVSEHYYRNRKRMGGSFELAHYDPKVKKVVGRITLHWSYRRFDPTWTIRELRLTAYWPIIDPWIRKRLVSDQYTYDEAPPSQRHEPARV